MKPTHELFRSRPVAAAMSAGVMWAGIRGSLEYGRHLVHNDETDKLNWVARHMGINLLPRIDHPQITELFLHIAQSFGVQPTALDREYYPAVFTMSNLLDKVVDEDHAYDLSGIIDAVIKRERHADIPDKVSTQFADVYGRLPDEKRIEMQNAQAFADLGKAIAQTDNLEEFSRLRMDEAALFGQLLSLPLYEDSDDHSARKRYNRWIGQFVAGAYAIDSVVDGRRDYESEIISVAPNVTYTLHMGKIGLREAMKSIIQMPARSYGAMGRYIVSKVYRNYAMTGSVFHHE